MRAWTSKGPGPYSETLHLHTEPDLVRAPMNLRGLATSESSIEIWWELVPSRGKVIGYQVCKFLCWYLKSVYQSCVPAYFFRVLGGRR